MIPPPHRVLASLKAALKDSHKTSNSFWSSFLTVVMHAAVQVFFPTNCPSLALDLTMQYGMSFFLHKAGNQQINSTGSTSCAMMTNLAFLDSTNSVTWLIPNLMTAGALFSVSFFPAMSLIRCAFCALVSGANFFTKRANCVYWVLSVVC